MDGLWLLYLQVLLVCGGLAFAVGLLVSTAFDLLALGRSKRNGANRILVKAGMLSEGVRIYLHVLVGLPTALAVWLFLIRGTTRPYQVNVLSLWLMQLTLAVSALSYIQWRTRRKLREYLQAHKPDDR
jgi:hypothetical protein